MGSDYPPFAATFDRAGRNADKVRFFTRVFVRVVSALQAVIDGRVLTQAEVEQRVEQYLEK